MLISFIVHFSQIQTQTQPVKKKSGFVITSVTDSGHGRPPSILHDGEESADDLDESHASLSDMSHSRMTDVDHDQESTASEDTLNLSQLHRKDKPPVSTAVTQESIQELPHDNHLPPHQKVEDVKMNDVAQGQVGFNECTTY